MAYPQPPPSPFNGLAYPWLSQWDPNYSAEYYVNAETGESTWTRPAAGDIGQQYGQRGFDPSTPSSGPSSGYEYNGSPASQSYPAYGQPTSRAAGEAASFYGNTQPSYAKSSSINNNSSYAAQPNSYDAAAASGEPGGERGLGKVIIAGGALWMAYKLYEDWKKNKLSSHQQGLLKPPEYAPHQQTGHGQYRVSQAFNPQQVYSQPPQMQQQYGGAYAQQHHQQPLQQNQQMPPPSYGSQYDGYSGAPYQAQKGFVDAPPPPPSFNGVPVDSAQPPYGNGGYDQYPAQQSQYSHQAQQQDRYQQPPFQQQQYQSSSSGWSDPRY